MREASHNSTNPKEQENDTAQGSLENGFEQWLRTKHPSDGQTRKPRVSLAFSEVSAHSSGTLADYQKTLSNYPFAIQSRLRDLVCQRPKSRINILHGCEGLLEEGEMLLVLDRPGSGCSTLLKTLAGQTKDYKVGQQAKLNYKGISMHVMNNEFRGECTYHAEDDTHIPQLTIKETLTLPALARAPCGSNDDQKNLGSGGRKAYARATVDAVTSALNLQSAAETRVGSAIISGASGGERKRASIAENMVCESSYQFWDNSTRGLDSANALDFLKAVRRYTKFTGSVAVLTLYQASQEMYNIFDKVCVLHKGYQVYFGGKDAAQEYFERIGFVRAERATTGDFLTSMTNPAACVISPEVQSQVPQCPFEFSTAWKGSPERASLIQQISKYYERHPLDRAELAQYRLVRKHYKSPQLRRHSSYIVGFTRQISLCSQRAIQVLGNDFAPPISNIIGNTIMSIILGSMFYNLQEDTASFFGRGVLLFFTVLLNTFLGAFEGVGVALWDIRPVVEKHTNLALYQPVAEVIASVLCDVPNKVLLTLGFNVPFYFLANLRRSTAAFLTFYLFAFMSLLTGSMLFRAIGALSTTLTASIAPGAVFVLMLVIYTGFVISIPDMHPWFGWFRYLDPVAYAFESLMVNEFDNRQFSCSEFVPSGSQYSRADANEIICAQVGARPGLTFVDGRDYLQTAFNYDTDHMWRNLGIIVVLFAFVTCIYIAATEYVSLRGSKGEILLFLRKTLAAKQRTTDEESRISSRAASPRKVIELSERSDGRVRSGCEPFMWRSLSFDIPEKGNHRRLLHGVEGFVRPGTLTAVMEQEKPRFLNVLADRAMSGIAQGEKVTRAQDDSDFSFARKVGYAQQMDVHLSTSTIREGLEFSALLRQPKTCSRQEKLAYVEEVIRLLEMQDFADAVVGVPGEGLNVEQRKKLTIGVELAARSELLLFLDEPTSGLDSNAAWTICRTLRRLADDGQSILCTIHQPSGVLFETFDQLFLLGPRGHQVYFGELGSRCKTLTNYFEQRGARKCLDSENCAEWLFNILASNATEKPVDWPQEWLQSNEKQKVDQQLREMRDSLLKPNGPILTKPDSPLLSSEYTTSFLTQLAHVTSRNCLHDWRSPSYLYSKAFLTGLAGIFNGFSFFHSQNNIQGAQNQLFSIFLLLTLFSNLVQLIIPQYIGNRVLYEARERPCRIYSWPVFVLSNAIAELPWQTMMAVILFLTWYWPLGSYLNAPADELSERSGLSFLFIWSFMVFTSTFSQLVITALPDAPLGVNIASLLYSLSLIFCGVLVAPSKLPHFWVWMVCVTPLTYFVEGLASSTMGNTTVACSGTELPNFNPPIGLKCGPYLQEYIMYTGGHLLNPDAYRGCQICPATSTDSILGQLDIYHSNRWRDFGITLAFSVINIVGALLLYRAFRMPWKQTRPVAKQIMS